MDFELRPPPPDAYAPANGAQTARAPSMQELINQAPSTYQREVLQRAGLDDAALASLTPEQRAVAFSQLVRCALTPGRHSITVRYRTFAFTSKTAGQVNGFKLDPKAVVGATRSVALLSDRVVAETLKAMGEAASGGRDLLAARLIAAKNGRITVEGRALPTQGALDMSKALEQRPVDEQRSELVGAGFPHDSVMGSTPAEVHRALTEVSLQISTPAQAKAVEVSLGSDAFKVTRGSTATTG